MHIAIIGGGINGYCCGVQVLNHFQSSNAPVEVTILSEEFSPNTTGDGSAGLWGPYLLEGTPSYKVHKWSKGMHDFLENIWLSEDAAEAGVCLIPVIRLTTENAKLEDFWKDIVYGCTQLTNNQLEEYNRGRRKKFTSGLHFVTYTSEPIKLLPYLMKMFHCKGGQVIQQKIEDLQQFARNSHYDAIINCAGLGAAGILKDKEMYPVRGQVVRVKANWVYYAFLDESDDGNYIIPNTETVVLGGTHQKGDYNTSVSSADKKFIVNGCRDLVPSLCNALHLFDWVGLRPGRGELRLEGELIGDTLIIHNYGHGGSGVTLAWGCAQEVLEILSKTLYKVKTPTSKL